MDSKKKINHFWYTKVLEYKQIENKDTADLIIKKLPIQKKNVLSKNIKV